MNNIGAVFLFICLFMTACATSPEGIKRQPSDFEYTINSSNLPEVSECLLRKMEAYPVLVGFSFEDRTMPVQIRQFTDNAELFQMYNFYIATLIQLQKVNASEIRATLHVGNHIMLAQDKVRIAYTNFIQKCP